MSEYSGSWAEAYENLRKMDKAGVSSLEELKHMERLRKSQNRNRIEGDYSYLKTDESFTDIRKELTDSHQRIIILESDKKALEEQNQELRETKARLNTALDDSSRMVQAMQKEIEDLKKHAGPRRIAVIRGSGV